MTLFLRITAILLMAFSAIMLFGVAVAPKPGDFVPALMVLGVGIGGFYLFLHARKRDARDEQVALTGRLLALAEKSNGALSVAQVVAALSLTADEARAALTQLSRDGLATFEVDEQGTAIYRVQKL
ncbi:MAG: hypothetical protein JST92_10495 [Deltaproteobacteria bacterium]|nr:hypothetical protein [Deltaproteobacteria bacterium]